MSTLSNFGQWSMGTVPISKIIKIQRVHIDNANIEILAYQIIFNLLRMTKIIK